MGGVLTWGAGGAGQDGAGVGDRGEETATGGGVLGGGEGASGGDDEDGGELHGDGLVGLWWSVCVV